MLDEVFYSIVSENAQSFMELYQYFERIFRIAALKHVQVLILPAPHKNCKINEKILVKAFKKAIAKYGNCFETIEFALSPDFTVKKTADAFYKAFSESHHEKKI